MPLRRIVVVAATTLLAFTAITNAQQPTRFSRSKLPVLANDDAAVYEDDSTTSPASRPAPSTGTPSTPTVLLPSLPITGAATALPTKLPETPRRLLVVYRSNRIPLDADARTTQAGARMLRRHDRLGTAVISATPTAQRSIANDPAVEFVLEDRPIQGNALRIAHPLLAATQLTARTNTPRLTMPDDAPPSTATQVAEDNLYSGPQGWPVRAVGGFGNATTPGAWTTTTGKGIRIAVIDSGVDRTHPDIAPNLVAQLTEVDATSLPSPCDDGSAQDQSGHGTWVASLALGAQGKGTGGIVGVAPDASLISIKALQRMPGAGKTAAERCAAGQPTGLISWVLKAIDDAVAQHADIIVLSMNFTADLYTGDAAGYKAAFDRATHAAATSGAVIIASAGNEAIDLTNPRYIELPAQARDVLAVVASTNPACAEDLRDNATCTSGPVTMPYYSNRGIPLRAVAAPGGSYPAGDAEGISGWIRAACATGLPGTLDGLPADNGHSLGCFNSGHRQYVSATGTSASAPLAAGVAALVRAAHPSWTPSVVIDALRASAVSTASINPGVVDAAKAIAYQP